MRFRRLTARRGRAVIARVEQSCDSELGCEFHCRVCQQGFPGDQVTAVAEAWHWWRPLIVAFECTECHRLYSFRPRNEKEKSMSRYRRPIHVNPAIEYTFTEDLEKARGWRIDFNDKKQWFVLTCKLGMQLGEVIPQAMGREVAETLKRLIRTHDYTSGHGKAE